MKKAVTPVHERDFQEQDDSYSDTFIQYGSPQYLALDTARPAAGPWICPSPVASCTDTKRHKQVSQQTPRPHGLSGSWLRPFCPPSSQLTSLMPLQYLTLLSSWGGCQPWPMVLRLSWGSPGTSGVQGLFLCLDYWGLSPPHVSLCSFVCRVKAINHIT